MPPAGFVVAVCAALLACASPHPLYEGPRRPLDEVAVLRAGHDTQVMEIDGRPVPRLETSFALEPGVHEVVYRARGGTERMPIEIRCALRIEVKPGDRLFIHSESASDRRGEPVYYETQMMTAVIDEESGEELAMVCD